MNQRDLNRNYFYTYEWKHITYKGIHICKYPSDLITYQEIIADVKPDLIIETGTYSGASALFFLDCMKLSGIHEPRVITSDIKAWKRKFDKIPGIIFIEKSSTDPYTLEIIRKNLEGRKVMVCLDSDHTKDHVYNEIIHYKDFVTKDQYLVVEDTFLGEYGVFESKDEVRFRPDTGQTPKDAIDKYLKHNKDFVRDTNRNKIISMNPNGYLKKC